MNVLFGQAFGLYVSVTEMSCGAPVDFEMVNGELTDDRLVEGGMVGACAELADGVLGGELVVPAEPVAARDFSVVAYLSRTTSC